MAGTLYKLRDMLCEELEKHAAKGEINMSSLSVIDTLTHAIKNLDKILMEEEGASYAGPDMGGSYGGSYRYGAGPIYRGGYSREGGDRYTSYARGRGANANRDSMGRYASDGYSRGDDGSMADQLREMADMATDERTRQEINRLASKLDR